jgi:GR25 family glycosyltransferase involved in LPS biosynthesis
MKDRDNSIITKGSAMAWLGHLNAVQWFLESNLTTALIIEDDVDWDIHIRHHQVPLIASQLRTLLSANPTDPHDQYTAIREHNRQKSYWGDLTQWEVLYLGHCGDNFDLKYWPDLPHNIFKDETVPVMEDLHPDTQRWLVEAGIGEHQRIIHRSKNPLCSFAYALNRKSAERMLTELSHEEYGHGTWSFDVRLLEACRDLNWKCWTSNPELFHHQDEHDSAITEVNGKPLFELQPQVGDGSTPNIGK